MVDMRVLPLLALLPSVVYTAAIQANANTISPQINGSLVPDQLVNATGLGIVDPRLTIDPEDGPDAINSLSAYMNALGFLIYSAIQDFDGKLTTAESVCVEPWDDVRITIHQFGPEPLERRFAIWGVFQAIYHMSRNSFTDSTIDLEYNGQPVGTVFFRLTRPNSLDATGSDNTNSTVDGLGAESITQTTYKPNGKDLSAAAIYISLASALVELAEKDALNPMFYLTLVWADLNTRIKVTPETRAAPPYMGVANGISAVWSTARYIAQRQRYAEYTSLIISEDMLIGRIDVDYVEGSPAVQRPGGSTAPKGVDTT